MLKRLLSSVVLSCTISIPISAQVINGYARVTNIMGTTIAVTGADESGDTFENGEYIIIMQMQDNVIGGNTGNNASFGDLGSIQSAGLWEVAQISVHGESGGVPSSITVAGPLTNTYNTGPNSRVQIITFPDLGAPDYTTTGNFTALDWNGNIGGILAFQVSGVLTIAHDLNADFAGYRGGARDNFSSGACDVTTYRNANTNAFAEKGEGIYRISNANYSYARGKVLSGGGGGNEHNGGGGGGSNFSAGGDGGPGWNCGGSSAGGLGGIDLSANIAANRFFMGGGGGGGEGNNNLSTDGGDGGGIVIIKADEVRTSGACGGYTISASGESVPVAGNDGCGGAGAGGTVHFLVNTWSISAGCPLTVEANGGNGGDVGHPAQHGGGGGGGQGAIIYDGPVPSSNVTNNTQPGSGGQNCSSCPNAGSGGGTSGDGIIGNSSGPLPIDLLSFTAVPVNQNVVLEWTTASETDNDYFTVLRSGDGINWEELSEVDGAGNSVVTLNYLSWDHLPLSGVSYYRLKQTDYNGNFSLSDIVPIDRKEQNQPVSLYPNPVDRGILNIETLTVVEEVKVMNGMGQSVFRRTGLSTTKLEIDMAHLSGGVYFVEVKTGSETYRDRVIIK